MATPAEIPDETTTAGDGYALVHVAEDRAYDADDVWTAQARRRLADTTPLATFSVTSRAGTTTDELTGEDETGNTMVVAELTGAQTRAMVGPNFCDLQVTPDGGDPITYIKWTLIVEQDVTR